MLQMGRRVVWQSSYQTHWDIRRHATLRLLSLDQVPLYKNLIAPFQVKAKTGGWTLAQEIQREYQFSVQNFLEKRFTYYELALPAYEGYRRNSNVFSMQADNSLEVKAYADPRTGDQDIFISSGLALALEEAAHLVFSAPDPPFSSPEINISMNTNDSGLDSLAKPPFGDFRRSLFEGYSGAFDQDYESPQFSDYKAHHDRFCDGLNAGQFFGQSIDASELQSFDMYANPQEFWFLNFLFSRVSISSTRQVMADSLSTLALNWVLGHEDAHRYSGHLGFFGSRLGADSEFDEFFASLTDQTDPAHRRSAEFEVDSASTTRLMDQVYDGEFLEMFFKNADPTILVDLFGSDSKSAEEAERTFLVRVIAGSAIMGLLLFEQARLNKSLDHSQSYPSTELRVLNVIFVALERAQAIQIGHPEYELGKVSGAHELLNTLQYIVSDTKKMAQCFVDAQIESGGNTPEYLFNVVENLNFAVIFRMWNLLCRMFGYETFSTYSANLSAIKDLLRKCDQDEANFLVEEFLAEKKLTFETAAEVFFPFRLAHYAGNETLTRKAQEDRNTFQNNALFIEENLGHI